MAIKWVRDAFSTKGTIEAMFEIANPVEPEFPFKIRLVIYNLQTDDPREKVPKKDERWRAHASFDKHELFRLYAADRDDAKKRTEEGLRQIFGALMASAAPEAEPR